MATATAEEAPAGPRPPAPRRPRRRLRMLLFRLILVGISLVFCMVFVEVVFRLLGYHAIYSVYSKPEIFWRHDAELGWSLEPGAKGEYVGPRPFPIEFRAPVRINSMGFRGPEVGPGEGRRRVLLVGDSQAAGFEVPERATYARLVEDRVRRDTGEPVDVINAGIRGYGTDQVLTLYTERLRRLRPEVVIFHATGNDPEDNTTLHRMRRPFGKPAYVVEADGSLRRVGYPVPNYALCSAYRVDAAGDVVRIDGGRTRAMCWLQSRLADHSAFLSFVTTRIQQNPRLLRMIYGLGTPSEQAAPLPAPSTPTSESTPAPPATDAPTPTTSAPAAAAPVGDYAQQLTAKLVMKLAQAVEADGARFVLVADDADLAWMNRPVLEAAGVRVLTTDESNVNVPDARWHNDPHMNETGHRRLAAHLAPVVEEVLAR